jgi:hypothetical protein
MIAADQNAENVRMAAQNTTIFLDFQAEHEGSIPVTRSNPNGTVGSVSKSREYCERRRFTCVQELHRILLRNPNDDRGEINDHPGPRGTIVVDSPAIRCRLFKWLRQNIVVSFSRVWKRPAGTARYASRA